MSIIVVRILLFVEEHQLRSGSLPHLKPATGMSTLTTTLKDISHKFVVTNGVKLHYVEMEAGKQSSSDDHHKPTTLPHAPLNQVDHHADHTTQFKGIHKEVMSFKGIEFNEAEITRQQAAAHFARLTTGIKLDQFQELPLIMKLPLPMLIGMSPPKAAHLLDRMKITQEAQLSTCL